MTTGTRLTIAVAVIAAVTGYMAYRGAGSSWRYYLTVDECAADLTELRGQPLRVNGHVAPNSLKIKPDRTEASFVLKGADREICVVCSGPLPDNLAENMDVVVEGRLDDCDLLQGDKVLTRCASKYRSKEPGHSDSTAAAEKPEVAR
jgi:cytochrome c-type biogenesis protein CcmE